MTPYQFIHLLSVVVWVGGMFFAYMALRPAAVEVLQPPERLRLWDRTFLRFFRWVWLAIGLLVLSGLYMIHLIGGLSNTPVFVLVMLAMGLAMIAIYFYVYFVSYKRLSRYVASQEWPRAGEALATIRKLVALNLALGLLTIAVAKLGRMFF
jgi:uncharacterized membrane protein